MCISYHTPQLHFLPHVTPAFLPHASHGHFLQHGTCAFLPHATRKFLPYATYVSFLHKCQWSISAVYNHLSNYYHRCISYRMPNLLLLKHVKRKTFASGGHPEMLPILADQWPIAPSYMSPNAGEGGGGCGVSANEYSCVWTWCPNTLWGSNSIFNLCYTHLHFLGHVL